MTGISAIRKTKITVNDFSRSLKFYENGMGMKVLQRQQDSIILGYADTSSGNNIELVQPNGNQINIGDVMFIENRIFL